MSRPTLDAEARAVIEASVRRACPDWMADFAEDMVQVAALKVLRSKHADLNRTYLWRVGYTVVIDEIRRRSRRNEVGMTPSLADRIVNSGELTPETRAQGARIGAELLDCLRELNETRRRAVTLYLQDHRIPEIAEMLGWDRKKASNNVYRGMEDLRRILRERGLEP